MSTTRLSPGTRDRLARLGFTASQVGRPFNRAAVLPSIMPTNSSQLEEMLGSPEQVQALFADKDAFKEFITNYAGTVQASAADIGVQVREETQRVLAEWLKTNQPTAVRRLNLDLASKPAMGPGASARNALYNPRALGASIDPDYKGSADYFQSIWHLADRSNPAVSARLTQLKNAFSSTVPSEGGFLIPETLRSELLSVALETAVVRSRARVIPMETLRVPFPSIDSTSNVSSVYGGIVGYWTEEAAALTASQAAFSRIILDAKKLTAYTEVPNELIADSAQSFQAFIDQFFPEALSFYEDYAFMRGTGVGEPLGFINCPASVALAAQASQPTATIVWENIVGMFARMLPQSLNRAVWIAAIDTFPQLATMALSVGTGGSAIWLNNGAQGPPMTILGRPVIFTEKVPTLGTTGDISFVDLGYYLIGDRQAMSASSSVDYKFQNDLTAFRVIERVDGRPWLQSPITPKNNSANTLTPFVQLATR